MNDDLLEQSKTWVGWEKHLCDGCKSRMRQKMKPIQRNYNQGGLRKKYAEVRMTSLTATLWRCLCHKCLRKIRKQAGV